jgi:hypothetical protein
MKRLLKHLGRTTAKVINRIKSKDTPRKVLVSYWALESFYSAGLIISLMIAGMYIQASIALALIALFTYAIRGVLHTETYQYART